MPITKQKLSGSTNGRGIKVAATSTPGTTIHTAQAGNAVGLFDEVWLWAINSATTNTTLTIQWGGTTAPDDSIAMDVPPQNVQGPVLIIPGWLIQNSLLIRAFATVTNVVMLNGYVNSLT